MRKDTINKLFINKDFFSIAGYFILFFGPLTNYLMSFNLSQDMKVIISDFGIYTILCIFLLSLNMKHLISELNRLKSMNPVKIIVYIVLTFILVIITSNIGLLIQSSLTGNATSDNQQAVNAVLANNNVKVFSILSIAVIGPLVEEIVFRLNFFALGKKVKINKMAVLFISSFIFGLVHVITSFDFASLPMYFLGGLAYGIMYVKSDNIYIPLMGHIIVNGLASI